MKPQKKSAANEIYSFIFGLFLGLTLWKFGNPVILDRVITPPASPSELWSDAWPIHWVNWFFLPLAVAGMLIAFFNKPRWRSTSWLWTLPLLWFGWQIFSASQTVDATLTSDTLWQFFGCIACYFLGAFILGRDRALPWLLIGVLAGFGFCLVRAVDQRLIEFPQTRQMLTEGMRDNWTNMTPATLMEMKRERIVINTNGVDIANPVILAKFEKGRVMGTLVYPNALAGAILLLWPATLTLAFGSGRRLRPFIRAIVIVLACILGGAGLIWSGSKLGWLILLAMGGICMLRLNWPAKLKYAALAIVIVLGLGVFALRFHGYFAAGATSASARLDYWRAAVQTTVRNPLVGTGPGTFQRPYERIKSPDAEMARLAHNDYLEQFSDSGIVGGIAYTAWIALALVFIGKRVWKSTHYLEFAIFLGLLGWFMQGMGEFSLYIPALAWTAFALLGCLVANEFDKNAPSG